ncbi:MAG: hypothetical protein QM725_03405 [Lacibacter sp.]
MKVFYIISGLFLVVFLCLIPFPRHIKEYDVQKNGTLVDVRIENLPGNCTGTKIKYFMKFMYSGQRLSKKISCHFAETHKVGDIIKLKHIEGTNIFLFENEKVESEIISLIILGIAGVGFIMYGVKQKSKGNVKK